LGVKGDISRLREIGGILVRHGFGHQAGRVKVFQRLGFGGQATEQDDPMDVARRFARMLPELGPTFVKLGQILSTRPDVLPPAFVVELSKLQDKVPPLAYPEIRHAIEEGLGGSVDEHFAEIEETPIASASVAQVHGALLHDGTAVVVKVQRPGISAQMATDSELIRKLAQVFEVMFEEVGTYGPVAVVEEWQKGLSLELDFENEAHTIRGFLRTHAQRTNVRIPHIYPEHCSRTVLTMERFKGRRLADVSGDEERRDAAQRLIRSAFEQVFEDGLFHADPHPGNFLVMDDGSIAILDFGLAGRLTKDSQDSLIALSMAIALSDADTVVRLVYRLGRPVDRIRLADFRSDMRQLLDNYLDRRLDEVQTNVLARDIFDLMAQYGLRIPREFALLAKAVVTFEGVIRNVYPDLDIRATVVPYAERLFSERFDPRQLTGGGVRTFLQLSGFIQDLPLQITQALMDFETGKTTVRMEASSVDALTRSFRSVGVAFLAGTAALSSVLAGLFSVDRWDATLFGLPAGLVLGFGVAGAALLSGSSYLLSGGRLPRLKLSRRRRPSMR